MSTTIDDLRKMLVASRLAAVKNLLAPTPEPFKKGDLERIENEVIARAQEGADLVEFLNIVRQIARDAKTPEKLLDRMRVAVAYPLPENPFADGLNEAVHICSEARCWLESVVARIVASQSILQPPPGPALTFQLFILSAILEFRLLHLDYIPAILESLKEDRQFLIHADKIGAIPLSLSFGSQKNAECRLLILRQESLKRLLEFLRIDGWKEFIQRHSSSGKKKDSGRLPLIGGIEDEAGKDPLNLPDSNSGTIPSIRALIDAAQKMAMLNMPSVVVAHRSRRLVSHSLPPEMLGTMIGKELKDFNLVRSEWLQADHEDEAPVIDASADAQEELPGIGALRDALGEHHTDEALLEQFASGRSENLKIMARFALYLRNQSNQRKGHAKGGGCGPATVRRYWLLIATKVIPRVSQGALLSTTEDAWEDALEDILDEDAFYHVRKYAKLPRSNAQTHSRPLVKAIRHWLKFLSQYRDNTEADCQSGVDSELTSGDIHPDVDNATKPDSRRELTKLADRLPVLGLVKVDASLITVDQHQQVWRRLGNLPSSNENDRSAQRVALTLGYRCGLRRSEVQWLRLIDFDDIDFLHVRPTEMRALKTSNARRDLPLALLMPEKELAHIRKRVSKIRALVEKKKLSPAKALLFSEPDNPIEPMDFVSRVLKPINSAFKADDRRGWPDIDRSFRFHRLRHSCASIQLLRLWPSTHRIAARLFEKNATATMRWIGDESKDFRTKLLGTHVTEADLQAIALILGHGSAATSLEHYIHVLDWYERPDTWD